MKKLFPNPVYQSVTMENVARTLAFNARHKHTPPTKQELLAHIEGLKHPLTGLTMGHLLDQQKERP
jgi:hypothetical protein